MSKFVFSKPEPPIAELKRGRLYLKPLAFADKGRCSAVVAQWGSRMVAVVKDQKGFDEAAGRVQWLLDLAANILVNYIDESEHPGIDADTIRAVMSPNDLMGALTALVSHTRLSDLERD